MKDNEKILSKIGNKIGTDKIIIILLVGVILLCFSLPDMNTAKEESGNRRDTYFYSDYSFLGEEYCDKDIEERLSSVLSLIEGVGESAVLVSRDEEDRIEGVIVVAKGGDDGEVVKCITEALEALLGLGAHKIKILKMV